MLLVGGAGRLGTTDGAICLILRLTVELNQGRSVEIDAASTAATRFQLIVNAFEHC